MPNYTLTAINVGSFALGESDKVLTLFSKERGLTKAVAKSARKPGTKVAGRAEVLCVNELLLATGKSLDIITQAQGIESFSELRKDLTRLAFALYYAELTVQFGQGLEEESQFFFEMLCDALSKQAKGEVDAALLSLEFELALLGLLGYRPELSMCVNCRRVLTDYSVSAFDHDAGGVLCQSCTPEKSRRTSPIVGERAAPKQYDDNGHSFITHLTPMVWKRLILALDPGTSDFGTDSRRQKESESSLKAAQAARRLVQSYIEHRAGRRMKALDLIQT
jgi:DNA repair protein RecO (recombination protein O)